MQEGKAQEHENKIGLGGVSKPLSVLKKDNTSETNHYLSNFSLSTFIPCGFFLYLILSERERRTSDNPNVTLVAIVL